MILHDVEQRSDAWYALRAGIPTASEFSKIITSAGIPSKSAVDYAYTLAGEMYAGKVLDPWQGNQWTERGREMEDEAISLYEFANDVKVQRVGFVTDDGFSMGCSPDGIVGDGGVEIKCLKAVNHIKAILRYQKFGKAPPDYVQQTQGQIWICGWAWCDLIFYHPELPLLVIRQEPDPEIIAALSVWVEKLCLARNDIHASIVALADADYDQEPKEQVA